MYQSNLLVTKKSECNHIEMKIKLLLIIFFCSLFIEYAYSQNPAAEVIKYQNTISNKGGVLFKSISCDIKINNREGDRFTKISIPFSKLTKVSKINACILDLSGKEIKKINLSDITEHSNFQVYSFFEDNMVKEFTLMHNIYPYIMSYKYIIQEKQFLFIDSWSPMVHDEIPTNDAFLTIELPINYPIIFKNTGTFNVKKDTIKNIIRYCWHANFTPIQLPENFMPNLHEYIPRVEVVPLNFLYEQIGSFKNWTAYGNWQYKLIENLSELSAEEKNKINIMLCHVTDKTEKIKILFHYLQDETRYVNISIKTGGMNPFPASLVAERKYGDCKALTNYMKAMLSYIDIPSYYTNVYASDVVKNIDITFPAQQFNHIILCVPLEKDTIWLDCTSKGPFNYLGTFTQNRNVFLIANNSSHFEKTPALKLRDVLDIRKVKFSLKAPSEVFAEFEKTYRSKDFVKLFYLNKYLTKNELNIAVNEDFIENGFESTDFKIIEPIRDSTLIGLKYNAITSQIYNQYGNDRVIRLLRFDIPDFSSPEARKYPIQIDFPINKSDTLDYIIPQSLIILNKPENKHIKSEFGEYSIQFLFENHRFRVIKSFILNAGTYTLKKYPAFYDYILKVKNFERNSLIIVN
jgi:hypothetical protein